MAAQATVRVDGAARLRRTLRAAGHDLDDMKDVHAAVAAYVAGVAAARTPRDTGALASSVRGNRAASRATVSAGYGRIPYAGPIHYGWPARNISGQPWLVDTAHDTEPVWTQRYRDGVDKALSQIRGA